MSSSPSPSAAKSSAGAGIAGAAGAAAAEFASWLVEPGLDAALPVLAEVVAVENVVVPETHLSWKRWLCAMGVG